MATIPRLSTGGGGGRGKKTLAWICFAFAVVAGAAFALAGLGGALDWTLGLFPWPWVPALVFVAVFVAMAIDLAVDRIPNQIAMWSAMLLPSLAQSVNGQLSETVRHLSNQIYAQISSGVAQWLGVAGAWGIAIVCTIVAYLMGRRVLAKGG